LIVNDYCSDLTRNVDIASETRIEAAGTDQETIDKINNVRRALLKQIQDYEAECVAWVEATKAKLLESIAATAKWIDLMESTSLPRYDNFKVELNEQADSHLCELKHILLQTRAFQFGGKLMRFVEGEDDECVGSLEIDRLRVPKVLQSHCQDHSQLGLSIF
jgi:hypothetical protein